MPALIIVSAAQEKSAYIFALTEKWIIGKHQTSFGPSGNLIYPSIVESHPLGLVRDVGRLHVVPKSWGPQVTGTIVQVRCGLFQLEGLALSYVLLGFQETFPLQANLISLTAFPRTDSVGG